MFNMFLFNVCVICSLRIIIVVCLMFLKSWFRFVFFGLIWLRWSVLWVSVMMVLVKRFRLFRFILRVFWYFCVMVLSDSVFRWYIVWWILLFMFVFLEMIVWIICSNWVRFFIMFCNLFINVFNWVCGLLIW